MAVLQAAQSFEHGQMVLVRPELRGKEQETWRQIVATEHGGAARSGKIFEVDAFRNHRDLLRQNAGEMSQHIVLDEFAAGLKVTGAGSAQDAGDFPAAPPRPAEKLWVVQVLDVVHGEQSGFPVVEAKQAER